MSVIFEKIGKEKDCKVQLCWEKRWILRYYEGDYCHEEIKFTNAEDAFDCYNNYYIGEVY